MREMTFLCKCVSFKRTESRRVKNQNCCGVKKYLCVYSICISMELTFMYEKEKSVVIDEERFTVE